MTAQLLGEREYEDGTEVPGRDALLALLGARIFASDVAFTFTFTLTFTCRRRCFCAPAAPTVEQQRAGGGPDAIAHHRLLLGGPSARRSLWSAAARRCLQL